MRLRWIAVAWLAMIGSAVAQTCPGTPSACGPVTFGTLTMGGQIALGTWATGGEPAAPKAGYFGFNTTAGLPEFYNGASWIFGGGGSGGGGSNTQVLFNSLGSAAGDPTFFFNSSTKLLSANSLAVTSGSISTAGAMTIGAGTSGVLFA